jgi:S-adenosylmethionine:tRNA ribosyltransferase-isomerase
MNARALAPNFDTEEMARAVDYLHLHGRRAFVTLNTALTTRELDAALDYAGELASLGVDALITADIGLMTELRRCLPDMELHASTQASLHSSDGAALLANELGVSRVVLARELSLDDIVSAVENSPAEIEIFLLRELNKELRLWDVLVDPARKIRIGNKLYFGDDDRMVAEVIDNTTSRGRTLRFLFDGDYDEFKQTLYSLGEMPLPRWVREKVEPIDAERYQTIYAKNEGAVAAPTAGLHFSPHLLKRLEIKGVNVAEITLHVGLGNFRMVDVEDLTKHKMDSEQFIIDPKAAEIVNKAKELDRKVCAIGTTTMRAIESSVAPNGRLKPNEGWTNKFIFDPYEFSVANCMITNFHLPYTTQLMMVSAFTGYETLM